MKSGIFIPKPAGPDEVLRTETDQKWKFMWNSGVLNGPGRTKTEQKFDIGDTNVEMTSRDKFANTRQNSDDGPWILV